MFRVNKHPAVAQHIPNTWNLLKEESPFITLVSLAGMISYGSLVHNF